MRINKFLAHAGLGSRRGVEEFIEEGRISVNGNVVFSLTTNIDVNKDKVQLDNKLVSLPEKFLYIVLNKPKNYICSRKDPEKRPLIYDLLPEKYQNFSYAGRLDFNSRGLVLLSNDGDFIAKLNNPKSKILKYYKVKVQGKIKDYPDLIPNLKKGIYSGKDFLKIHDVWNFDSSSITIALEQGKNRHIRKMFEAQNITIRDLYRYGIGDLLQGDLLLPLGSFAKIRKEHIINLEGKKIKTYYKKRKEKVKEEDDWKSGKVKDRIKSRPTSRRQAVTKREQDKNSKSDRNPRFKKVRKK